jgi:hypothetical protein
MSPIIIQERLKQRTRLLRLRWHEDGDALLMGGRYLEFADGLLRLMRQLDAISSAVERQTQSYEFSHLTRSGAAGNIASRGMGTVRPKRGPTNDLA